MKKEKLMQIFRLESIATIDRVLMKDIRELFKWANKLGMQGIEVSDLEIEKSNNPLDITNQAACEVHLNEERNNE